ncbi:MAG: hypothetical protein LBC53_06550 [Spirochaetaceae bacterium]|jgi:hypothetical protein|nr:hypothetical protein [Spirochaetaceae bacterium]
MKKLSILNESIFFSVLRIITRPFLLKPALEVLLSINKNFFGLQKKAYKKKIHIPVVNVEHALDSAIPFRPEYVKIYMDFTYFWIRAAGFFLRSFGGEAEPYVKSFLIDIKDVYAFAARVYSKMTSTTRRPVYKKSFLFRVIYAFDPHLMCVPSLHVMVVVYTYSKARSIFAALGVEDAFKDDIKAARDHALAITDSILFVKQHSVNCIAAALYALNCFNSSLLTKDEARLFTGGLLGENNGIVNEEDKKAVREYILNLFETFCEEKESHKNWEDVLINFLKKSPAA